MSELVDAGAEAIATVYFVGAGPGAPGLVTVRGAELVARAEVLVVDAEVSAELVARARAECVRRVADPARGAEVIGAELVSDARAGRAVVRLVSGDPLLLSRAAGEVRHVGASGVPFEVVPGLVPAAAAFAYVGLASEGGSVALAGSTSEAGVPWAKLAWAADTLVVETDAAGVGEAATRLLGEGRDPSTPAAVAAHLTGPKQRVRAGTLADIATRARALRGDRLVLAVGASADERAPLAWFERLPLFGKRVLVTRTREQASSTEALLRERGAEPIVFPTIVLHPPQDPAPLEAAVAALAEGRGAPGPGYDWVAFTSANAVDFTWREIERTGRDARIFGGARLAAIGPGTATSLAARGLVADVVAKDLKGEGLAAEMMRTMSASLSHATATTVRVLLPRAKEAREVLPETLRAAGCQVDVVPVYETRSPETSAVDSLAELFVARSVDAALFTSSSTADNLVDLLGDRAPSLLAGVVLASIGPITTATLERRGFRANVTASASTVPGLVGALEAHFRKA